MKVPDSVVIRLQRCHRCSSKIPMQFVHLGVVNYIVLNHKVFKLEIILKLFAPIICVLFKCMHARVRVMIMSFKLM